MSRRVTILLAALALILAGFGYASRAIRLYADQMARRRLNTQLIRSVVRGDVDGVTRLLAEGASLDVSPPHPVTPLMVAVQHRNVAIGKLLLERGADPNARDEDDGFTPLMFAAARDDTRFIKLLLAYGARAGDTSNRGEDALAIARESNAKRAVALLKSIQGTPAGSSRSRGRSSGTGTPAQPGRDGVSAADPP
jgi:ankyrin repeat protein